MKLSSFEVGEREQLCGMHGAVAYIFCVVKNCESNQRQITNKIQMMVLVSHIYPIEVRTTSDLDLLAIHYFVGLWREAFLALPTIYASTMVMTGVLNTSE